MIKLEDKMGAVIGNAAKDLETTKAEPIDCIPYVGIPYNIGLINASVPLTRRQRRALKRKKK